jgi:1,4-dihydroxy-2-naphthoate octaprenyltransferase
MMRHWVQAMRPKTLTLAVVPVLVGSCLAWVETGGLALLTAAATLAAALLIQIGTNLHNDAADFERGADNPATRLGPPRATAEGWLSATQVRRGALLSFGTAMLFGLYLVWIGGWPILISGLVCVAAGLAYTAGPRPIAYSALGELFVLLFFGLVAVGGSYYLQTGRLTSIALLGGLTVGLPAAAVLSVNNHRDRDNDRAIGKMTLAVHLGPKGSLRAYAGLMIGPFALLPLWWQASSARGPEYLLPLMVLPYALLLIRRFQTERPGPALNRLLADTARFQLLLCLLICAAVLSGASPLQAATVTGQVPTSLRTTGQG